MDHSMHAAEPDGMPLQPGTQMPGGHENHANDLLDGWGEEEQELLGMLHVPLLHGGVKEVLLLPSLSTASPGSFALACILLALCTAFVEVLRLAAWWVEHRRINKPGKQTRGGACECKHCTSVTVSLRGVAEGKQYNAIHDANSGESLSIQPSSSSSLSARRTGLWLAASAVLNLLIYLTSTLLMLIAMTMNIYLILSMGVGASCGKVAVLLARRRMEDGPCK
ncbi:uncharacterized protein LOC125034712 [Penaeus chinensis]|uniref:uncharacterized protein LOC125034712 n=1 Tax=Penaeus chinensis TaxID=139456 RepID=UPI001FB6E11D|nr:uncharacterized protein LOC125034712 [Penaeus chinensis]